MPRKSTLVLFRLFSSSRKGDTMTSKESPEVASQASFSKSEESAKRSSAPRWLKRIGYLAVNAWLIMHLTAIITAPATVGPSSQTARNVWEFVSPYLQGAYLNHGFHYFAPQPGSSNLVSWTVTLEDGSTKSGRFPNFDIKPRLLYHRHFMLSEFLGNSDPETQSVLIRAYARNLLREHNATRVALSTVRHDLPSMERVRAGGKLDDGDLYEEQPLGFFERDELL